MMVIAMIAVFVINLLLGLPLSLCLLFAALVGFPFVDPALPANTLPQRFFGGMDIFSLMAILLFVLTDNLMNYSGTTPCLMRLTSTPVSHLHGGLGHVNVVTGVFFAGVNGSATAGASTLSILLVPTMEKEGYSRRPAARLTVSSSLIGPITPPSIFMILYSSLIDISMGELLFVGTTPGSLLVVTFMLLNAAYAYRNGLQAHHAAPAWGGILAALSGALAALIAPAIIVAGIVLGLITPIKSGTLIVLYVTLIGLLQRQLSLAGLRSSLRETVRLTASIYAIIAATSVVNWSFNCAQIANEFAQLLEPFGHSPTLMLFIISVVIFVYGIFMGKVLVLMLLIPIIAPVALTAGMDPVHLGLIFTLNIAIALIVPPTGVCLFIMATISRLDTLEMFKGIWPFILLALGVLSLLILFLSLAL